MTGGDHRGVIGGLLVTLAGGGFAWTAWGYPLGSPGAPGPGAFPLGVALAAMLFGITIALTALARTARTYPAITLRAPLSVLGAIAAFALLIQRVGLVPTVLAVTLIAAIGSSDRKPAHLIGLAVFMGLSCWLIFRLLMGMNLPAFRNPL